MIRMRKVTVWNEDVAEEKVDVAVGSDSSDVAALSNQISGVYELEWCKCCE